MAHYHKRSNVESTFSAIKRKFGDSVMSKTDAAMANEVLCKVLCHNLTCPISGTGDAWRRAGVLAGRGSRRAGRDSDGDTRSAT
jgi:hypothetical protein